MRDFNDKDRTRKSSRKQLGANPADLPPETLDRLEAAVNAALKNGYLSCPAGWKLAKNMNVPRIAVGAVMDKLGVRITDCQIGFFKVDKTPYTGHAPQAPSQDVADGLRELDAAHTLTCSAVFELAHRLKTTPLKVSEAASGMGLKIRDCQLGCF